ncbi:MAG: RNA methyltransferase [Thermoplasmatota archaeon]
MPPRIHVVLVEPQYPGNVGSVARAMANFGLEHLILVRPCPITESARDMAVHAQSILDKAEILDDFGVVADRMGWLVAFAARASALDKTHLRVPTTLAQVAKTLYELDGDVALVFGREDNGLANEDVARCDVVCTISTSENYRSMNLSHAAAVAFHTIFAARFESEEPRSSKPFERELLQKHVAALMDAVEMQPHRKEIALMMWRRVMGRAGLSEWEYHRMMGIFAPALKRLGAWPIEGQKRGGGRLRAPARIPTTRPRTGRSGRSGLKKRAKAKVSRNGTKRPGGATRITRKKQAR